MTISKHIERAKHIKRVERAVSSIGLLALLIGSQMMTGCVPLVIGGAAAGGVAVVASDRRTSRAIMDDEVIDFQVGRIINNALGDNVHVNINSYNRKVLLTGEVPTLQDLDTAQKLALGVEDVKSVVNELGIMSVSSFSQRSTDAMMTTRVKSGLLSTRDLSSNAFKVITERGVVFLMGRVTAQEALLATEIAATTPGVLKVVRVLDIVTPEELARTR